MIVVPLSELGECVLEFVQISERADPQQLLFQCAEEAFDAAVPFRLTDERRRRFHTDEADLRLKVIAHIDAAMVVAQPHAARYAGGESAEVLANALPDRLERFEPMRAFDGVNADAVGAAMIDGGEDGYLAILFGEGRSAVGSPQLVRALGDNSPLVGVGRTRRGLSTWRE